MSDAHQADLARANIQAALRLRGKSSFEISVALGKNRTYLDDFLKGRKASLASMFEERLGRALDIDREYVLGHLELSSDDEQSFKVPKEIATAARIKRSLNWIQEEIDDLEQKKAAKKQIDDDYLANAYERRARHTLLLTAAEQRVAKVPSLPLTEASNEPFEAGWSLSNTFAKQSLSTLSAYLAVIKVSDNSMRDHNGNGFNSGDRVIIDRTQLDLRSGGLFALMNTGSAIIRVVDPAPSVNSTPIICRALNALYPPFEIVQSKEQSVLGRVVAHIRTL